MLLSRNATIRHLKEGNLIIHPFKEQNVGENSYDVTLGKYYYRHERSSDGEIHLFNPFSETQVRRYWGNYREATSLREWLKKNHFQDNGLFEGIGLDDLVIWVHPYETLLAHTEEFIGGKIGVTSSMQGRSSWARSCIQIECGGLGDVGFYNRWTMEITNISDSMVPLVVGRRIAQILFHEVERDDRDEYGKRGKYQEETSLEGLVKNWKPEMMLPRLWKEPEVQNLKKQ